jgi:hypothetical protein
MSVVLWGDSNVLPNTPIGTSPPHDAILNSREVTLEWQDTGDPDNGPNRTRLFHVEVWHNGAVVASRDRIPETSWTLTLPNNGVFEWIVRAYDGEVYSEWSVARRFTINHPPHTPTLLAPANGSVTNNTSVTLAWKDNGDPDDKPHDSRDFHTRVYQGDKLIDDRKSSPETSWTITDLEPGTYTWDVRAGDGGANGDWTKLWSFTVDTVKPSGDITLNSGWDSANRVSVPLALTASDEHSSVADMRLGQDCSSLGDWQPFQSHLWWQLAGQHGDTASVCVQYRDRAGNESNSIEKSIALDFYPAQPASSTYRLQKDVAARSGGSHQSSSYRLSGTGGQTLASGDAATSTSYRATLGFWALMEGSGSPALMPPTLLAPTNGITMTSSMVTFSWQDGNDVQSPAQEFLVEVRDTAGTVIESSGWLTDTTWTAPALDDNTYRWLVKARSDGQESTWSPAWTVTVDTDATTPDPDPDHAPTLISDYTVGSPGSTFVFTATNFPADSLMTISIREPGMTGFVELHQHTIPDNGTLVFVIPIMSSAPTGEYTVRVETQLPGMTVAQDQTIVRERMLTIQQDAALHDNRPPEDSIEMRPVGDGRTTRSQQVYLPLVVR